jgi:hypothetical protein
VENIFPRKEEKNSEIYSRKTQFYFIFKSPIFGSNNDLKKKGWEREISACDNWKQANSSVPASRISHPK